MFREFEKREALQRYLNGEKVSVMYDETLTAESPTYTVEPLDDMLGRFRFLVELPEQKEVKTQAVQSEKQDNNKQDNEPDNKSENIKMEETEPEEGIINLRKICDNKQTLDAEQKGTDPENQGIITSQTLNPYGKVSSLDEHTEEIKDFLNKGISRKLIAEKYNVRTQTLNYWLQKHGIVPSAPRIPKDNGKRKCSSCQYRQTDKNLGNCAYIEIMGHTRGCNAIECDKYVKGKPLKKRKDSGAEMVNEDPKERVEEVK